jgi:hypothetical protein
MLRNWGGIVDVTPDRSPIIGKTPVKGLYVNCGWGTGGFKATPGSANVFAHTIAKDEPHPINAAFTLDRFRTGRLRLCLLSYDSGGRCGAKQLRRLLHSAPRQKGDRTHRQSRAHAEQKGPRLRLHVA